MDEVERVSRSETQTVGAERKRAEHRLSRTPVAVAQDDGALRDGAVRSADFGRLLDPVRKAAGQPAALEPVARGAVRVGAEEAKLRLFGRQNETHVGHAGQLVGEFRECMEGQRCRSQIHSMTGLKPGLDEIYYAIRSRVGDDSSRGLRRVGRTRSRASAPATRVMPR